MPNVADRTDLRAEFTQCFQENNQVEMTMTKLEITRLLAMIAHEDTDPDTFNFVLNRIFGAIQGAAASLE